MKIKLTTEVKKNGKLLHRAGDIVTVARTVANHQPGAYVGSGANEIFVSCENFTPIQEITGATTRLERHVQKWINEQAKEYDDGARGVLKDLLFHGGCASGYVSHLIYYHDTATFFATYRRDISALLKETISNCGHSASDVFGKEWDESDPLAQETDNRNLLAWFGFEETARSLASRNGIEI